METVIYCSWDPNDKSVEPKGIASSNYIPNNQELNYLIRFQNTGNDTATNVIIIDTLATDLDITTFTYLAASHPVKINIINNIVTFEFDSIMLPDSSVNMINSNGFIKFSIHPLPGLYPNIVLSNKADIFFDYNPPVSTNIVFNTIECWIVPSQPQIEFFSGFLSVSDTIAIQWYLNDTIIPGANSNILYPMWSGEYTVEVTNQYGCSAFSNNFDYIVGTDSPEEGIKMFPNPTTGLLTIETNKIINVKVSDITGRKILDEDCQDNKIQIDLSDIKKGIYILEIKTEKTVYSEKVIVE
jgi:uncharacterized repeat protein (TIGR01451 family)